MLSQKFIAGLFILTSSGCNVSVCWNHYYMNVVVFKKFWKALYSLASETVKYHKCWLVRPGAVLPTSIDTKEIFSMYTTIVLSLIRQSLSAKSYPAMISYLSKLV